MKVLIVDDQADIRKSFRKERAILEAANLELLEASDGPEAYKLFSENKEISHMVVDIHMPIMNGRILIEKLRHDYPKRMKTTKVFLMCTEKSVYEIGDGNRVGVATPVEYWLFKPVNPVSFFTFVNRDIKEREVGTNTQQTLNDLFDKIGELSPIEKERAIHLLESFLDQLS